VGRVLQQVGQQQLLKRRHVEQQQLLAELVGQQHHIPEQRHGQLQLRQEPERRGEQHFAEQLLAELVGQQQVRRQP